MPNINRIDPDQAQGETDEFYTEAGRSLIMQCLSLRPDFGKLISQAANVVHFRNGFLTRREHEAIATYVSALNHCPF